MKRIPAFVLVVSLLFLSACDTAEERAEKHFQSAIELLEVGDEQRAIVELKNVLKLNPKHRRARSKFANLKRINGDLPAAAAHYLRLAEQYPDDFDSQLAIAEIYAETGNWDEMEPFVAAANALMPDDNRAVAVRLALNYRNSVEANNPDETSVAVKAVQELTAELPKHILLRRILIDYHMRLENFQAALGEIDAAIVLRPDERELYVARLVTLAEIGDVIGIENQLRALVERYPDDHSTRVELVQWYLSQGQIAEAELFLDQLATRQGSSTEDKMSYIRFVTEYRGTQSAMQELDLLAENDEQATLLHGLRAGLDFDLGNHEAAIQDLRALLENLEQSEEQRKLMMALAQMLFVTGGEVEARELVTKVLAEDPTNLEALHRQADWLIGDDKTTEAIEALRTALEQAPQSTKILTSLARAYERDGRSELVGDVLKLAMESTDGGPIEAIQYADFLRARGNIEIAEETLLDALRDHPNDVSILKELGAIYIANATWNSAQQVRANLARIGSEDAITAGNELQAQILQSQQKTPEAIEFLQTLAAEGETEIDVDIAIIRNFLIDGDQLAAKKHLAQLLAADPGNTEIQFLDASLDIAFGDTEAAERKFRKLVNHDGTLVQAWVALFRIHNAGDRPDDAKDVIDQAREHLPGDASLMWIDAGLLEAAGQYEAAIAIYEKMYESDSDNLIVANNLASLLSTSRTDKDSLNRARIISRRLKSTQVAAYQDTYGWISYLNGDYPDAVQALEIAAAGLENDATVQFHLAKAYLANNNDGDALAAFHRVVEMTEGDESLDITIESLRESAKLASQSGNSTSE